MKDEMREDLLITREDILMHLSMESAELCDEEETLAPLPACRTNVFFGLLRWLFKNEN